MGREVSNEMLMKNMFYWGLSRYFIPNENDEQKIDVQVREDGVPIGSFKYNANKNGFIKPFQISRSFVIATIRGLSCKASGKTICFVLMSTVFRIKFN